MAVEPSRGRGLGEEDRRQPETLREEIDRLLVEKSYSPLGGLVGVPLVNVLEVNLAIGDRYRTAGDK